MSAAAVDQFARDAIARVDARIERHEAVCEKIAEANKHTLERIERVAGQINRAYEVGMTDLKENSKEARERIEEDVEDLRKVLAQFIAKQSETNRNLFNRFWSIGIAWGSTMTGLAGFFAGKYFHLF